MNTKPEVNATTNATTNATSNASPNTTSNTKPNTTSTLPKRYRKLNKQTYQQIANMYSSGRFTTEQLAKQFNVSTKSIQRVAKAMGVLRSRAESNRLMSKNKHYYKRPAHLKSKRVHLSTRVRYELISEHPYCAVCGSTVNGGARLEIDHIDEDSSNNELSNLQVLCSSCNVGKFNSNR